MCTRAYILYFNDFIWGFLGYTEGVKLSYSKVPIFGVQSGKKFTGQQKITQTPPVRNIRYAHLPQGRGSFHNVKRFHFCFLLLLSGPLHLLLLSGPLHTKRALALNTRLLQPGKREFYKGTLLKLSESSREENQIPVILPKTHIVQSCPGIEYV